jgi:hypothetical protein
VRLVSF